MALRFCPRCRAEVDDVGGFCLLGHRFPAAPVEDPIADLRAEVDKAFEKIGSEVPTVGSVVGPALVAQPKRPSVFDDLALTPEDEELVIEPHRDVWAELREDVTVSRNDPITAFAPAPSMDWGSSKARKKRR